MSAKLIVHKFESGINFKSLQINISDVDDKTNFSEWAEGKPRRSDEAKSSRLIVKIVSGNECDGLDLDSCARKVNNPEMYYFDATFHHNDYKNNQNLISYEVKNSAISQVNTPLPHDKNVNCGTNLTFSSFDLSDQEKQGSDKDGLEDLSLDYSLERVKENNAKIMETIHMLNRTLNYTKKKETLNISNPKTMRHTCNTCGKCFVYETGLKRHFSMRHSINQIQPRWQIVWTCVECFQVWPRQDLAMTHLSQCSANNNAQCVREIKTSSLIQCEFCEKVFTSIPRLLKHCKVHTTENNYECNACESRFQSYKAAEQHWLLCPWLKMCYNFSLPKMLLCNTCDRKFKNYDQLYSHRYKAGHFMVKVKFPCDKGPKNDGFLVYQCELCSQWFPSVAALKNHRSLCQKFNEHHSIFEVENYYDNNGTTNSNYFDSLAGTEYQSIQIDNMHSQRHT